MATLQQRANGALFDPATDITVKTCLICILNNLILSKNVTEDPLGPLINPCH